MAITSTQFSSHKTWLQDVINVSSPIQNQLTKNLKNHLHENLIPFSTQNMGLWYRELKDIFMHGRSDWVDVKIAASCVFYLGGPNSAITRYRIYWDFWGKSFRTGGPWLWLGPFDEGYCLILLTHLFMTACCGLTSVPTGHTSFVVRTGEKWYLAQVLALLWFPKVDYNIWPSRINGFGLNLVFLDIWYHKGNIFWNKSQGKYWVFLS